MSFVDRADAGRRLAENLGPHRRQTDTVVLALPRGGVVVAAVVARRLELPLDVWVARKVGAPQFPEFGMGAVGHHGVVVMDERTVRMLGLGPRELEESIERERAELRRRLMRYRGSETPADVRGKSVILVDDGLATGSTAKAAIEALRKGGAAHIIVALPVAPRDAMPVLRSLADALVVLETPRDFGAVGKWYEEFGQTSDQEVLSLLSGSAAPEGAVA